MTQTRMQGVTIGSRPGNGVDNSSRFIGNDGTNMKLKVYEYKNCGTCRKALQYLKANGVEFSTVAIREQPPSATELRQMLKQYGGEIRKLFNTSGQDYQAMKLKDRLPQLSAEEAIKLLTENGNLVKRPFVVAPNGGVVGFKEEEWKRLLP
jgi:arsenate reductase